MTWSMIFTILIEVWKQRAAAGFPLIKLILEYFGIKIQREADEDTSPITMGDAPDEVKDQIVAWLEGRMAAAPIRLKWMWAILIRFAPLASDQLWDSLFKAGHVGKPLSDFVPMVFATNQSEAELIEEALAA